MFKSFGFRGLGLRGVGPRVQACRGLRCYLKDHGT